MSNLSEQSTKISVFTGSYREARREMIQDVFYCVEEFRKMLQQVEMRYVQEEDEQIESRRFDRAEVNWNWNEHYQFKFNFFARKKFDEIQKELADIKESIQRLEKKGTRKKKQKRRQKKKKNPPVMK